MNKISDFGPYELDTGISDLTHQRHSPPLRKGGQGGSGEAVLSPSMARLSTCATSPSSILHPLSSMPPRRATHRRPYGLRSPESHTRGAFTLIEMLVAVGLVVLMMTLFATIFQMATGAMSTQKGLAENDQRVRLVLSRLRNDLNGKKQGQDQNDPNRPYRTFGWVVPWGPDEDTSASITVGSTVYSASDRKGYLSISENDPNDDTDDTLSLTVQFPNGSADQFFGRAAIVFADSSGNYGPAGSSPTPGANPYPTPGIASLTPANSPGNGQAYYPNQPEFDDIQGTPNGVGDSQFAEVCYFLRRGTLYRRVMLIRQPNVSGFIANDGTPTDNSNNSLNVASLTVASPYGMNATRNFLTDFDYSAYFDLRSGSGLRFHGTGATSIITIDSLLATNSVTNPFTLGNPAYRFGFDSTTTLVGANQVPSATYGQPREYITTAAGATPPSTTFFIGRFTHGETSDLTFGYPGNLTTNPTNLNTNLNFNTTTGAVSSFAGPRAGEDVLMTNVLKFDIKVFDPAASVGPDGAPGVAGVNDNNNFDASGNAIIDEPAELGWPGSDDGDFRDIGHLGQTGFYASFGSALVGDYDGVNSAAQRIQGPTNTPVTSRVVIPSSYTGPPVTTTYNSFTQRPYPNTNYNYGIATANSPPLAPFANRYDTWNPALSLTNTKDGSGNAITESPPFRPFNFGADRAPGTAGFDDDGNGKVDYVVDPVTGLTVPDPREIGWPGSDDRPCPLTAIQIKITFYDRTAKQVRETTLVQSLSYTP